MRATLTLAALHFTTFPTQRALMQAGAVLVALGGTLTFGGLAGALLPLVGAVTLLGAVLLLVPLAATLGIVFRMLSLPRTHRLLPFFRRRMLAATGLVLAAATGATAWLVSSSDGLALSASIAYTAVAWSTLLWLPFFGQRGLAALVPVLPAAWIAQRAFGLGVDDVPPLAVGIGLAAAWGAFAAWYLRAGPLDALAPHRSVRLLGAPSATRDGARPRGLSAAERTDLYVHGSPALFGPRAKAMRYAIELCSVGVIYLVLGTIELASAVRAAFATPFAAAVLAFPVALAAAARARRLWLRAPLGRAGLLGTVERALVRSEPARLTAFATAIVVVHASLAGIAPGQVVAIVLAVVTTAASGTFVGLMIPSRTRLVDWVVGGAYGLTALVGAVAAAVARTDVLLGIACVLAAGAVLCRLTAQRRWRRIDWLVLRARRIERGT